MASFDFGPQYQRFDQQEQQQAQNGEHFAFGGGGGGGGNIHFKDQNKKEELMVERKKAFKGTEMNGRQRRGEGVITLRKDRREETMAKRRAACQPRVPTAVPTVVPDEKKSPEDQLTRYTQMLHSIPPDMTPEQKTMLMDALIHMREWSRIPKFPMAGKIIQAKLISPLIRIYHANTFTIEMATEAAWILNNLSSVSAHAVKEMMQLGITDLIYPCIVHARSQDHFQNSVWLLANLCARHPDYRDQIERNIVPIIMQLTKDEANLKRMSVDALKQISFLIRNICRAWERDKDELELKTNGLHPMGKEFRQCNFDFTKRLCPILWLMCNHNDPQVILNSVEAFRHLLLDFTENNIRIEELTKQYPQMIKVLIQLITHVESGVSREALNCLAYIASGNESHTQAVVDAGAIAPTLQVLTPAFKKIHKQSREVTIRGYFLLSNITNGTTKQCSAVINTSVRDSDGKEWSALDIMMNDISHSFITIVPEVCHVLFGIVNRLSISKLPSSHPEYIERMKMYYAVMSMKQKPHDTTSWIISGLISRITNFNAASPELLETSLKVIQELLHLGQYRSLKPNAVPTYVEVKEKSLQENKMCYDMEITDGFELVNQIRLSHENPAIYELAQEILSVFHDELLDNDFDGPDFEDDGGGEDVATFTRTVLPQIHDQKQASNFWSKSGAASAAAADIKYSGSSSNYSSSAAASSSTSYEGANVHFTSPSQPMIAPSMLPPIPHPSFTRHPTCGESAMSD